MTRKIVNPIKNPVGRPVGRPKKTDEERARYGKLRQISVIITEELYWEVKSLITKRRENFADFFIDITEKEIMKQKDRSEKFEAGETWNI